MVQPEDGAVTKARTPIYGAVVAAPVCRVAAALPVASVSRVHARGGVAAVSQLVGHTARRSKSVAPGKALIRRKVADIVHEPWIVLRLDRQPLLRQLQ